MVRTCVLSNTSRRLQKPRQEQNHGLERPRNVWEKMKNLAECQNKSCTVSFKITSFQLKLRYISCHHLPCQDMMMNIELITISIILMTVVYFYYFLQFTVSASLRIPTGPTIICLRITAFSIPKKPIRR